MARHVAPLTAREPAVLIGLGVGVIVAILALLVAFGVDLTQEQTAAILGVFGALAALAQAILTRSQVTPTATAVPRDEVVVQVAPEPAVHVIAGPASTLPDGTPVTVQRAG